jgi:hypothetical protein
MPPSFGSGMRDLDGETMSGTPFLVLETLGGSQVPLGDPTRFGRAEENTVVLRDVSVSSHHAVIRKDGAFWIVEDLASTNGTWLNHKRVDGSAVIKEGDRIQMGSQMIRVGGFRSSGDRRALAAAPACPRCAKPLPGDAAFCPFCGLPLGGPPMPAPTGVESDRRVSVSPTAPFAISPPNGALPPRKANMVMGCILLAAILVLVSLVAGWWLWDGFLKSRLSGTNTKSAQIAVS